MRIAVTAHLDEPAISLLRAQLIDYEVEWEPDEASGQWRPELASCEVVFGSVPASWIADLRSLRWLQLESVGFEPLREVQSEFIEREIAVTNLGGQFAHPTAETALAGTLALLRGIDQLAELQADRRWASLEVRPTTETLHGKTVVILGAGSIGRRLRHLFAAFDCQVFSYARTSPVAELHTLDELDALLPHAQVVANCLPGTSETSQLLDRRRLSLLTSETVFVNVGRGSVVDQGELVSALRNRRIGGAVLDVTEEEPLSASSPLWSLPRTVLTQHTGGGYGDELIDKARRFLENMSRWRAGLPLEAPVNWTQGY